MTGEAKGGPGGLPVGGVLVGGRSRRYGSPKESVPVGGVPMAVRALRALEPHAGSLYLLGGGTGDPAPGGAPTAARLPDLRPGGGPLAGVEALLAEATSRGAPGGVTLPTDLPLLGAEVVALLLQAAAREPGRAVVLAGPSRDDVHPLCAYWPTRVLVELRSLLDDGERTARRAASALGARVLSPEALAGAGDPERIFLNVNAPADRSRAERLLARDPRGGDSAR